MIVLALQPPISLAAVVLHQVRNFLNWNSEKCQREKEPYMKFLRRRDC